MAARQGRESRKMLIVIKGAGDLASGIALRLHHSRFDIVMTDLPVPLAVRRTVAFSEAVRLGSTQVEDVRAERAENEEEVRDCLRRGVIPVMPDPEAKIIGIMRPEVVVDAILAIPFGATATYGDIAAAIARKRGLARMSAQAVGQAVGWNPICIVVPCHRVVGAAGALVGYGGGLRNKIALLAHEKRSIP